MMYTKSMRKGFAPFIIILVVVVLAFIGFSYFKSPQNSIPTPEDKVMMEDKYQKVEIDQLVVDPKAWDGKKVQVTGTVDTSARPHVFCVPNERGPNPEYRNEYRVYPSAWGISDEENRIGVVVKDDNGIQVSDVPSNSEEESLTVHALAHYTNISSEYECNDNIFFETIYLEVNASDVGIQTKPLPPNAPSN